MTNAHEDSEDARLTRGVVRSVMAESRGAVSALVELDVAHALSDWRARLRVASVE